MLRSVFSNWFASLIMGVLSFLLTPFTIHHLGNLNYGLWALAWSLVGYTGLLEMGIRPTTLRYVSRLKGAGDQKAINDFFSTALGLTLCIGLVISLVAILGSWSLPGFFKLAPGARRNFALVISIIGFNLGSTSVELLFASYLSALHRFDLYNLVQVTREVMRALLTVLVLETGHGIVALGVVGIIVNICAIPLAWAWIRRIDPLLQISLRRFELARGRELLGFSFWMLLNNAGATLRNNTASIVIGRMLETALITPFSVAARLVRYLYQLIVGISGPLLPKMAQLEGAGKRAELRAFFLRSTRLTALVTFSVATLLALDGKLVLRLWVGPQLASSYPLMILILVGSAATWSQAPSPQLLIACGKHRVYGLWTVAEGVAVVLLSVYYARHYGLMGVALGGMVPLLALKLTLQPWYTLRVAGISFREYLTKAVGGPSLAAGVSLLLGYLGASLLHGETFFALLRNLLWQVPAIAAMAWFVGMNALDRLQARSLLERLTQSGSRALGMNTQKADHNAAPGGAEGRDPEAAGEQLTSKRPLL